MILKPLPIELPPLPGTNDPPVWVGEGFRVGGKLCSVLEYVDGETEGWSDELTSFHEETAGENHYIDRASREHAVSRLEKWLPSKRGGSPVILDIGCSSGFLLKTLKSRLPEAVVVGSDFVRNPLMKLAAEWPGLPLLRFDLVRCPLPDAVLDAAVLLNVLEHIEDDFAAVRQVFRILKPGGIAVVEVPANPDLYDVYDKLLLHWRRYRMKDLLARFEGAGFEVLEKSHLGFLLYPGFWLVKKRNRRYLAADVERQRQIVAANIRQGSSSQFLARLMRWEASLRGRVYLPTGIRCLLVCRRPA